MKARSIRTSRAGALSAALVIAILLIGSGLGTAASLPGTIDGVVVDAAGKPISGVLVAAVAASRGSGPGDTHAAAKTVSGKDGSFRFSKLPAGSYGITATGGDHAAVYHDVVAVSGEKPVRSLKLVMGSDPVVVSGSVLRFDRAPVAGAEIRAVRYSDFEADVFYGKTDRAGTFTLALPRARYWVHAVAQGFDSDSKNTPSDSGGVLEFRLGRAVPPGPAPVAVVDWIRRHEVPLRTAEAGHGFDDMEPIRAIVGNARLVSLGEATHGTREFFQLKHRMLEFLVERMGFTVFGIEATMPEGFDVNEYVLTGVGDPGRALSGLYFWTWDTQEVLEMIRWMRAYNADPAHTRKVKFYGFDMQRSARAAQVALAYVRRFNPELAAAKAPALATLSDPFRESTLGWRAFTPDHPARKAAEELLREIDNLKTAAHEGRSSREWAVARQHARVLVQNVQLRSGEAIRDRSMAENIQWILEHEGPEAKMVTWAHNLHAATEAGEGMGQHLRAALGSDMVIFGFAFHQGSFQAVEMPFGSPKGLHPFTVGPAPVGSLDETLSRAGARIAALDLRRIPPGPVAEWFGSRLKTRNIGAGFSDSLAASYLTPLVPARNFDALLFVDNTTSAVPNRPRAPVPTVAASADNLGFERDSAGSAPSAWAGHFSALAAPYVVDVTDDRPRNGHRCARIRSVEGPRYGETFGHLYQRVDATPYRGKKVKLRAFVRVEKGAAGDAAARLWVRAGQPTGAPPVYGGSDAPEITAADWREYELVAEVPSDCSMLDFGVALVGTGTAWVDDVVIDPAP